MQFSGNLLILDNDASRRKALETIFGFLGLSCQVGEPCDCLSYFECDSSNIDICVIGVLDKDLKPKKIIEEHKNTAFLTLQEAKIDTSDLNNCMGTITSDPDYDQIVTLLHYCQSFISMKHYASRSGSGATSLIKMLVGQGKAITAVRRLIEQVAVTDANVLILGESGTGKEVVAHAIHELSNRSKKPFVPVNCGAIPGELLESELFGHEKGAFTGEFAAHEGRFELAQGGTLFLDEIGDMPLAMQVKLLRVLQERKFERVGSNKQIEADVRIIAATHQNLEQMVKDKTFREDLYYRLNVFPIATPPLRDRADDIPLLIQELVNRHSAKQHVSIRFTQRAMMQLMQNEWHGNVRELSNLVERLLILHPNEIIDLEDLPPNYRGIKTENSDYDERAALLDSFSTLDDNEFLDEESLEIADNQPVSLPPLPVIEGEEEMAGAFIPALTTDGVNLKDMVANIEISMIKQAIEQTGGIVTKAAEILGLRRTTLVEKMKKYGLSSQG